MFHSLASFAGRFHHVKRPTRRLSLPAVGDMYYHRPEAGPVEYAEVIGRYEEAERIQHVRFRLILGYRDKMVEAGERTLALDSFAKRFTGKIRRDDPPAE